MNSLAPTPNESVPLQRTRKEMLNLCAQSWVESQPPADLNQDVSLRFGAEENFPFHPKDHDLQQWVKWLETVMERFPLEREDVARFQEVRSEVSDHKEDRLKELAAALVQNHLSPDRT